MSLPTPEPAAPSDLDALVALEDEVFPEDRISRASWRRLLREAHGRVLVIRGAGGGDPPLLGAAVVLLRERAGAARLYSLAVAPAARGRGVARRLLEGGMGYAAAAGRSRLSLEVRADNEAALGLYRDIGFHEVRALADYYGPGAHGVRMERSLDPGLGESWKHLFQLA